MALFSTLILAGGALAIGAVSRRRPAPLRLVDGLIDGKPKAAHRLPPNTPCALSRAQVLAEVFFGDTRQQQQQALNVSYDASAEQRAEQVQKQNLIMAASGLGLGIVGALVTPFFYLPSVIFSLYAFRLPLQEVYRLFVEEHHLDYRALWAITVPAALASGHIVAGGFGNFFFLLSIYLMAKTENRSQQQIADLFGGQVRTVWLLINGVEVETPFADVHAGNTVVIHAGQMIPVDGTITSGAATIDQHMLTGESQPVEKGEGDGVLASTIVLSGRVCIRVDRAGGATVAAQITDMLSQTNHFKQTLESRTDRFMNQITLPVLATSVLALPLAGVGGAIAVLWYYPGGRMMVFGPISMLSYLQAAAQRGILIKDGRALEALNEIDTVVFDKTGTLTLEQPTVSRILCYNGVVESEILRFAAGAEAKQSHPIAKAILQAATAKEVTLPQLEHAEYKVGYGLKVNIEGRVTYVGSIRFMMTEGIAVPPEIVAQQAASHAQGHSLVLVALDGEIVGALELAPTLRPEATALIKTLHERGIETAIISGDNEAPTRRMAADLGIDRYFAEVLPEEKANLVTQLQAEGHKVCFVGDGINDSIALKTADVAVSLRGATTIATDMAEIIFMNGTLAQLPELFTLADEFAANMRVNLVASMTPGIVGIGGTLLFGWGMTICVFLMQVSTPVGVYNAVKPLLQERMVDRIISNQTT